MSKIKTRDVETDASNSRRRAVKATLIMSLMIGTMETAVMAAAITCVHRFLTRQTDIRLIIH